MKNHHVALSTYQFKRAKADGLIQVFNEGCYLMAEYNERTGAVSWQRVLLATQREMVERWLRERYPVREATVSPAVKPVAKTVVKTVVKTQVVKHEVAKTEVKRAVKTSARTRPVVSAKAVVKSKAQRAG